MEHQQLHEAVSFRFCISVSAVVSEYIYHCMLYMCDFHYVRTDGCICNICYEIQDEKTADEHVILNLFPGMLAMIAVYFTLKSFNLTNSYAGLIMVYSASSGLGYLIAKGFFDTVPRALCEAARIDGCSEARIFFQMVLPMSRPIVVYTVISSFLVPWMDFVYAKMILNAGISSKYTVAIGLYKMLDKSLINSYFTQFCAGGVLVSIPISILFMIMQKFYVEGITGGAVKG